VICSIAAPQCLTAKLTAKVDPLLGLVIRAGGRSEDQYPGQDPTARIILLASIGVIGSATAGGRSTSGDFSARMAAPEGATAGGRITGSDFHAALGGKMKDAPRITVSGHKPGIAAGDN
jgi:hypothetical protein